MAGMMMVVQALVQVAEPVDSAALEPLFEFQMLLRYMCSKAQSQTPLLTRAQRTQQIENVGHPEWRSSSLLPVPLPHGIPHWHRHTVTQLPFRPRRQAPLFW